MDKKILKLIDNRYSEIISTLFGKVDGGYLSDNFIVGNAREKYFLKEYREKYTEQDIQNIHKTKSLFSANRIPVIMPRLDKQGRSYFKFEGHFYSLFPFIDARLIKPEKASDKAVDSMAKMQAKMHLTGKKYSIPKVHENEVPVWNKKKAKARGKRILEILNKKSKHNEFDKLALKFVKLKMELIENNKLTPLKIGLGSDHLIHGDYHSLNLFFDRSDNVQYIFDLEKTVYAPRAYELVRAMDYICLNDYNFPKARAYLSAYRKVYPISDSEYRRGFLFYHLNGVHAFWIEEFHYLDNNKRTDVFYVGDSRKTAYYSKNFEDVVNQILGKKSVRTTSKKPAKNCDK